MSKVFGIDLGTTYSCISYIDEYGKPVVLKNLDGQHTTPSVVLIDGNDIIVGAEAKRSLEVEPEKTVPFIKRKMGKENDIVSIDGIDYHAPEISAMILTKLVNDANDELRQTGVINAGEEIKDVVITCPAYFGMNERKATQTAGELAGLNVLNIINEPTAAAISYGVSGQNKDETVLVYDLGGGTFDITVMNINNNAISVVCTGGDDELGGKDWDEALMNYVAERYDEEYGEDIMDDFDTVSQLYVQVEEWKKSLTSREKVNIVVNGPSGRLREELTREQYEELTRDLLNRTKNLLDDVLKKSEAKGFPVSRIDKVLLVGGSSRMPQVANMLQKDYGITPELADPDEAVAKGAAIYAANEKVFNDFVSEEAAKTGRSVEEIIDQNAIDGSLDTKFAQTASTSIKITNVLSRTYGIEAIVGERGETKIINMLKINDALPAKHVQMFYTHVEGQTGADISLYESRSTENEMEIDDKRPITVINMKFNTAVPVGTPIAVQMALDNSGVLHIIALEQYSNSKLDTTFSLSNQMTDAELNSASIRMAKANVE